MTQVVTSFITWHDCKDHESEPNPPMLGMCTNPADFTQEQSKSAHIPSCGKVSF